MKELQSLGLDIRVLRDDNTEVEIMENIDYGDTDFRFEMEGESRNYDQKGESFDGYQKQEFSENGELETVEDEDEMLEDMDFEDSFDE